MPTDIEWTRGDDGSKGETWNPTVGCSKVSPGCDNCYAISVAHRAMQPAHEGLTIKRAGERPDWTGTVKCLPDRLDTPLHWRRPRRVFVDSMSDLFHPDVPMAFILKVWSSMSRCPQHTFQVLTKRPQRAAKIVSAIAWDWDGDDKGGEAYVWPGYQHGDDEETGAWEWEPTEADLDGGGEVPLRNVWLGTSIESDRYAFRADHLRATPAAVRFLSLEPLLGPLPSLDLTGIDWVIVGGESGPGARPMHPDWVRDIRDRCVAAGVAFFFKQWGSYGPNSGADAIIADRRNRRVIVANDGTVYRPGDLDWPNGPRRGEAIRAGHDKANLTLLYDVGKKLAGRVLDGRTWDEMPEAAA